MEGTKQHDKNLNTPHRLEMEGAGVACGEKGGDWVKTGERPQRGEGDRCEGMEIGTSVVSCQQVPVGVQATLLVTPVVSGDTFLVTQLLQDLQGGEALGDDGSDLWGHAAGLWGASGHPGG